MPDKIGIRFDRPRAQRGFVMIDYVIVTDTDLSDGAFRTYAVLRKFAWDHEASLTEDGDPFCYPGLTRIAEERGQSERNVIRHIQEIVKRGYLTKERRGQGQTNLYIIVTSLLAFELRSDNIVISRSDTGVTRSILSKDSADNAAAKGGEPALKAQAYTREKLMGAINAFRDLHLRKKQRKYLVNWSRDTAALKPVLETYPLDTVQQMIAIYITMPRRRYTVAAFATAVPDLIVLLDEWQTRQARKQKIQGELTALERLSRGFEEEVINAGAMLKTLDERLTALIKPGIIPDAATRDAIARVNEDSAVVMSGIFERACQSAGVPTGLAGEVLKEIDGQWDDVRGAIKKCTQRRIPKEGGDKPAG